MRYGIYTNNAHAFVDFCFRNEWSQENIACLPEGFRWTMGRLFVKLLGFDLFQEPSPSRQ